MVANVEAALLAAPRSGDISPTPIVNGNCHGISNCGITRPFRYHELGFPVRALTRTWVRCDSGNVDRMNVGPVIGITPKDRDSEQASLSRDDLVGHDSAAGLAF